MPHQNGIAHRIMEIVLRCPGCLLEEVAFQCPDLTWNQVFLAVDRLSRSGELRLTPKEPGVYSLRLSNPPPAFLAPSDEGDDRDARY